jgi:hypothetical protein
LDYLWSSKSVAVMFKRLLLLTCLGSLVSTQAFAQPSVSTVPGQIYQTCTTSGNPLDPNNDGWVTASGVTYTAGNTEESTEFEGSGWIIVPQMDPEPSGDLDTGASCGSTELVDNPNTSERGCYVRVVDPNGTPASGDEFLVIRFRVAANPVGAFGYSMLIDSDLKNREQWCPSRPEFHLWQSGIRA